MIDITEIMNLLVKLIFSGLGIIFAWAIKRYVIPWLQSKFSQNQLSTAKAFAAQMIKAAEQLEANGYFSEFENKASAKKDYVLKAVLSQVQKWGFTFDENTVSDLIESQIAPTKYNEFIAQVKQ